MTEGKSQRHKPQQNIGGINMLIGTNVATEAYR